MRLTASVIVGVLAMCGSQAVVAAAQTALPGGFPKPSPTEFFPACCSNNACPRLCGPTPLPTETPATHAPCVGDCDRNGAVQISELITGVAIALGTAPLDTCEAFECRPHAAGIVITCAVEAVRNALMGCAEAPASPSATPAATFTCVPRDTPIPDAACTACVELEPCVAINRRGVCRPDVDESCFCDTEGPTPTSTPVNVCPESTPTPTSDECPGCAADGSCSITIEGVEYPGRCGGSVFIGGQCYRLCDAPLPDVCGAAGDRDVACLTRGNIGILHGHCRHGTCVPDDCGELEWVGGCCDFQGERPCYRLDFGADATKCVYTDGGYPQGCLDSVICNTSTGLCEAN